LTYLVVDAQVQREAAAHEGASANAVAFALALQAIAAEESLGLAVNRRLMQEYGWEKPERGFISEFASALLRDLTARDRVARVADEPDEALACAVNGLYQNEKTMAEKDVHLVVAALATDRRILSHEKRARRAFRTAIPADARLAALHWVSPADSHCRAWLGQGAPDEPAYHLTQPPAW
jgi:hypothetical protein